MNDTSVIAFGVPSILLVEDDETTRLMLRGVLRREGFVVHAAADGPSGRALALQLKPDLILMDINMPGENGLAACRALKADPRTADIPVLFLSAQEQADTKVEGFAAGGADYVTKPYHPAELIARVRLHVRLQRTYRSMVAAHLAQLTTLATAQQVLLPQPAEHPGANFAAIYLPRHLAGGDFYDVFQVGEHMHDYVVADVSGHDLGTALPTAAIKALLRQNAAMQYPPHESLQLLNRHVQPVFHEGQYATLVYFRLDRSRRQAAILNAGHGPAVLMRQSGAIEILRPSGDVLGAFDTFAVEPLTFGVAAGDRVFLFSDGLIEQGRDGAAVSRKEGLAALGAACELTRAMPLETSLATIISAVLPGAELRMDDVVLLGVEV